FREAAGDSLLSACAGASTADAPRGSKPSCADAPQPLIDPLSWHEKLIGGRHIAVHQGATGEHIVENEWDVVRNDRGWPARGAGMGILRIALLFGSAGVALALILPPIAESQTRSYLAQGGAPFGLDEITTGTIKKGGNSYTIRKSVLQS